MTRCKGHIEKPHSKTDTRINVYTMFFIKKKETWISSIIPSAWFHSVLKVLELRCGLKEMQKAEPDSRRQSHMAFFPLTQRVNFSKKKNVLSPRFCQQQLFCLFLSDLVLAVLSSGDHEKRAHTNAGKSVWQRTCIRFHVCLINPNPATPLRISIISPASPEAGPQDVGLNALLLLRELVLSYTHARMPER